MSHQSMMGQFMGMFNLSIMCAPGLDVNIWNETKSFNCSIILYRFKRWWFYGLYFPMLFSGDMRKSLYVSMVTNEK